MLCKHGIEVEWCALCAELQQKGNRVPRKRKEITVFGSKALQTAGLANAKWGIVHTGTYFRKREFDEVNGNCLFVHIDGRPFLWAIRKIIEICPNLVAIQVPLSSYHRIGPTAKRLCQDRGIRIITGFWKPNTKWKEKKPRSPDYKKQRHFFLNLDGEQSAMFDELLQMGFRCAAIAHRYFCLDGQDYMPQWKIGLDYGFRKVGDESVICTLINAVMYYLDPSFPATDKQTVIAANLRLKVLKLRAYFADVYDVIHIRDILKEKYDWELQSVVPPARIELLEAILSKRGSKEYRKLQTHKKKFALFSSRFGLDDGVYKTLEEVGKEFGVSKQWVAQNEEHCLALLGLTDEVL